MSNLTYSEKLRLPAWQQKRLEILNRDNWTCLSCGRNDPSVPVHVHHLKYFPGLDPWEYEPQYLVTYCEKCHNAEHLIGNDLRDFFMTVVSADRIYLKPMAQLGTLMDRWPQFQTMLKNFLNEAMIQYLKSQQPTT